MTAHREVPMAIDTESDDFGSLLERILIGAERCVRDGTGC